MVSSNFLGSIGSISPTSEIDYKFPADPCNTNCVSFESYQLVKHSNNDEKLTPDQIIEDLFVKVFTTKYCWYLSQLFIISLLIKSTSALTNTTTIIFHFICVIEYSIKSRLTLSFISTQTKHEAKSIRPNSYFSHFLNLVNFKNGTFLRHLLHSTPS